MKSNLFAIASMLLVACGAQEKSADESAATSSRIAPVEAPVQKAAEPQQQRRSSLAVDSEKGLPACDAASEGALAYVRETFGFLACGGGAWTEVAVASGHDGENGKDGRDGKDGAEGANGKDGHSTLVDSQPIDPGDLCASGGVSVTPFVDADADGLMGEGEATGEARAICDGIDGAVGSTGAIGAVGAVGQTGSKGDDGADGNDNHLVETYSCVGSIWSARMHSSTPTGMISRYTIDVFASGDTHARAQISWPDAASPAGYGQIVPAWYAGSDAAAQTASISVGMNYVLGATTGLWTWNLNRAAGTASVDYFDPDLSAPTTISFSHACTKTVH